jgi:CRP-like cAMP-binding protein
MAIDALVKPFLSLPIFRGLKPLELTEIVRRAHRIVYKPGDTIIEEDQTGDAAIVIVAGRGLRIVGGDRMNAEPVSEGSLIGELAMLVDTVHTSTVIADTQVRALRITREDMHELMLEEPALAEHFSSQIAGRLKRLALELRSVDDALEKVTSFDWTHAFQPPPSGVPLIH